MGKAGGVEVDLLGSLSDPTPEVLTKVSHTKSSLKQQPKRMVSKLLLRIKSLLLELTQVGFCFLRCVQWDTTSLGKFLFDSVFRNPNGKGLPQWPKYDRKEGYLQIGASPQASQKLKDEQVSFWIELHA